MLFVFHVWCMYLGMMQVLELNTLLLLVKPLGNGLIPAACNCAVSSEICVSASSCLTRLFVNRKLHDTDEVVYWKVIKSAVQAMRSRKQIQYGCFFMEGFCLYVLYANKSS